MRAAKRAGLHVDQDAAAQTLERRAQCAKIKREFLLRWLLKQTNPACPEPMVEQTAHMFSICKVPDLIWQWGQRVGIVPTLRKPVEDERLSVSEKKTENMLKGGSCVECPVPLVKLYLLCWQMCTAST